MRTVSAGADRRERSRRPVRRLRDPVDHRRRAVAVERDLAARRPAGSARCRDRRVADRAEAVEQRFRQLGAGERLDHRAVAERQHGEHLAPRDLAGRLGPPAAARTRRSARRPPELVSAASTPGYFAAHRVGDEVAHRRLAQARRVAQDVDRLRADHLVAQRRRLGVGRVDDRLHVGPRRDAEGLGDARRRAGPGDVVALDHQLRDRVAAAGVEALDDRDVGRRRCWRSRCVWPAMTRSTVVSLQRLGDRR